MENYQCTKALYVINGLVATTTQEKKSVLHSTLGQTVLAKSIIDPIKLRLV